MRRGFASAVLLLAGAAAGIGLLAGTASAQKGVLGLGANPNTGVISLDRDFRYLAIAGGRGTVVAKIATDGGTIERSRQLDARLTVPAVAFDGTPGGLSADGGTLVLTEPGWRFPQLESRFFVFDAGSLRHEATISLDGSWTYDAISPDGRALYLIEYTSPRDLTEYRVRAYDLRSGELDADPIIDPNESGEDMYGTPFARATSAGGRWAYTLYESTERDHPPFIHALDTQRGTAVCIDLDPLADHDNIYRLGLQPSADGSTLSVIERGEPVAHVDLSSFEVSEPAPPAPVAPPATDEGDGLPWAPIAGSAALLIAAAALLVKWRRPDRPGEIELDDLVDLDGGREREETREREPVA
jgi:hypothetical protein